MNLAALKGVLVKNKLAILGVGGAGIVGVALLSKRGDATEEDDGSGTRTTTSPQSLATYDSEASDVYNALQPQLESVANQLDELNANSVAAGKSPTQVIPTPVINITNKLPKAKPKTKAQKKAEAAKKKKQARDKKQAAKWRKAQAKKKKKAEAAKKKKAAAKKKKAAPKKKKK